jgi:hypothetical protein
MDMKKILQAFDGASTKPVGGSHDMKKFLSVVTESTNRQSVAEQMITQEYSKPKVKQGNGIIKKYFENVQHELHEEAQEELTQRKQIIAEKTQRVLEKMKKAEAPKPRNFVAKNATTGGAGAHKDKKKAVKQGDVKHKGKALDIAEINLGSYRKKATMDRAMHQIDNVFGDPEKKAHHQHKIAQRSAGLNRADSRVEKKMKAMPKPVPEPVDKAVLHARLAALEKEFDPHYEYSDDHKVWSHHKGIDQSIQRIKRQLRSVDEEFGSTIQKVVNKVGDTLANALPQDMRPFDNQTAAKNSAAQRPSKESVSEGDEDPCWSNYHMVGTKKKRGRTVPNCVPNKKG